MGLTMGHGNGAAMPIVAVTCSRDGAFKRVASIVSYDLKRVWHSETRLKHS